MQRYPGITLFLKMEMHEPACALFSRGPIEVAGRSWWVQTARVTQNVAKGLLVNQ